MSQKSKQQLPPDLEQAVIELNKKHAKKPAKLTQITSEKIRLSLKHKTIIASGLLGDFSLKQPTGNFKNSRLQAKHSLKQKEWFAWKSKQISIILGKTPFAGQVENTTIKNPSTGQSQVISINNKKIRLQSRNLSCLTSFYEEVSDKNQLDFSKPWLDQYVNDQGLMIWWLDDGGLIANSRVAKLSCHNFTQLQKQQLQQFLKRQFNLDSKISKNKYNNTTYTYLTFSKLNTKLLLNIVMPHIPVSDMLYKIYIKYDNVPFQQHWIAVMYERVNSKLHPSLIQLVGPKPNLQQHAKYLLKTHYSAQSEAELIARPSNFIKLINDNFKR